MSNLTRNAAYQDLLEQISRTYATGRGAALQAVNTQLLQTTGRWGGRSWSSSRAAKTGPNTARA